MDLRQMRYFVVLAEELNFGRAAARLHIAQPPLTRQIKAMESQLGAVLFNRTPKGAELTEAGKVLLLESRHVLDMARRAEERTRLAGGGFIGQLEVGIFGSAVLDVVPRILSRFHELRPDVKIALFNQTKAEQIQALRDRVIAIGFNRLVPVEPDIDVEIVLRERVLVGLHASSPLCRKTTVSIADLANQPMILYPNLPMHGLAQEVISAFHREGTPLQVAYQVEDVLTCIALVASGSGSCITAESAASLRLPNVVYRPLHSRFLRDLELSCLFRKNDESPILAEFLKTVRSFEPERAGPGAEVPGPAD